MSGAARTGRGAGWAAAWRLPRAALLPSVALLLLAACTGGPAQRPESTRAETAAAYNLQLGVAYLRQEKLALAREKLDRAVKQNPRDPQIHNARALLAEKLNDPTEADRSYRAALRLAP